MKDKVTIFNPGSSKQWAERLTEKYGWKPKTTDSGNPIVDEETLKSLKYPEAKAWVWSISDINKKMGMVTDWIKRCRDDESMVVPTRRARPLAALHTHSPTSHRSRRTTTAERCSVPAVTAGCRSAAT